MRTMLRDRSIGFVLQSASLALLACSSSSRPYAPRDAAGDTVLRDGPVAAETTADQAQAGDLVSPDAARAGDTALDVPLTHDAPVPDGPAQEDVASSGDARTLDGSTHAPQTADAAPSDASADGPGFASDASASACLGTYESCICACCDSVARAVACYFPTAGETIADLRAADEAKRAQTICGTCSAGTNYVCCMPAPPEAASSASYTATGYSGGLDHLTISKSGTDCASVAFVAPSKGREGFRIDAGTYFGPEGAQVSTCGDPNSAIPVKWALGTLGFRMSGTTCLIDLHVTLFRIGDSGQIFTTRMDADGLPLPSGMPSGFCK